jgi:uncharacterized protein YbjT (DUF2867 family)
VNALKTVLIAGASGYLGSRVGRQAKERGYRVRVLIRKPEQTERLGFTPDDVRIAQATRPDSLKGLCDGVDIVFSSLGITRQKDGLTYEQVDFQANRNLLDLAEGAGVGRFVYISVFQGQALRRTRMVEAKERFVDMLEASAIDSCIIRPTGFFSDMADFLAMADTGRVYLFGDGAMRFNPIDGEDLAVACVEAFESRAETIEIGGPETFTLNEIARLAIDSLGNSARIIHLPDIARRISLFLLPWLTPMSFYGPLQFFLTATGMDMNAPEYGKSRLIHFFRETARKRFQSVQDILQ